MSSEAKDTNCDKDRNSSSTAEPHNANPADKCREKLDEVVANDIKELHTDEAKFQSDLASVGMKLPKKELPNLPPISQPSSSNLVVKEERSSISEEDSSENLECLDWSCSGSREDESSYLQSQSQRPKTVSFHTGSSLPVERKISNGKK